MATTIDSNDDIGEEEHRATGDDDPTQLAPPGDGQHPWSGTEVGLTFLSCCTSSRFTKFTTLYTTTSVPEIGVAPYIDHHPGCLCACSSPRTMVDIRQAVSVKGRHESPSLLQNFPRL